MATTSAADSLLGDATRAARLRSWIIGIGVPAPAAYVSSAAYDTWRSHEQIVASNNRELANLAKALAEQADGSLQLADLLLRETATWYETDHPAPGGAADARLAARAAGLPQVGAVSIAGADGLL